MARDTKPIPTTDLIRAQLRRFRNAAGLSQEDFGKLAHYSASMVSAVELGQRPLDRQFLSRADEVLETDNLLVSLLELARRDGEPSWFRPWLDFQMLMAEQLQHLVSCADLSHVSVHVVPAEAVLHVGLSGPFVLARSAEGGWVGHMETQLGGTVVESDEDIATLLGIWEGVRNEALPRRQSIELIKEVAKTWT